MLIKQDGTSILEILGALAIGTAMLIGLSKAVDSSLESTKGQQASLYQSQVTQATIKYINANYSSIGPSGTTAPYVITLSMLKTGNFLPASFSATNAYQQTTCIIIRSTYNASTTSYLMNALIVTSGGQAIEDTEGPLMAGNAGQGGGFIRSTTSSTAEGSFGSWKLDGSSTPPLTDFVGGTSCLTGTSADGGHLASALFYDGPSSLSTDYLYRKVVPGHPELNQLNTTLSFNLSVPAVENQTDANCTGVAPTIGVIATNSAGQVLSCQAGGWKPQGSMYWKDPVDDYGALTSLPTTDNNHGDVRVIRDKHLAFMWDQPSLAWCALSADNSGNLTITKLVSDNVTTNNLQLNQIATVNTACPPSSDGLVARDSNGMILSCQSGFWGRQSSITLGSSESDVIIILKSNKKAYGPSDKFYSGAYTYDAANDWYYATITRHVAPTRDGVVSLNAYTAMDRQLAPPATPVKGQVKILVRAVDLDTGLEVGRVEGRLPKLNNDVGIVSTTFLKTLPKNTNGYDIEITTAWTTFDFSGMYTESNYIDAFGAISEQTPIYCGWTLEVYY